MNVAIIAHGEAQEAFDRHLKYWEAFDPNLTVYCPSDDIIKTTHDRVLSGKCGRATGDSIERLKLILESFVRKEQSHLMIFEYDSFALEPERLALQEGALFGIAMTNLDSRFIAPRYLNPPWLLDRQVALKLLETGKRYPFIIETGEVDRWISAMAHLSGIPMLDYSPRGFSKGTIGHEHFSEMHTAIYEGATVFHGIKYRIAYDTILQYVDEAKKKRVTQFDKIYAAGGWDGQGSGPGSTEEFTRDFRLFLRKWIEQYGVEQVIDLACGDWQWQRHMDWAGVKYTGVDIVEQVVNANVIEFAKENVQFALRDCLGHARVMVREKSPNRLVIVKDLLHHLGRAGCDLLASYLNAEQVLWVVDVTDDGKVIGPSKYVREKYFDQLQVVFEFNRPTTYIYGRKVVLAQNYIGYARHAPTTDLVME